MPKLQMPKPTERNDAGAESHSEIQKPIKGSPVWLDLDQAKLDRAYSQGVWAPNSDLIRQRQIIAGKQVLQRVGAPNRIAYGPTEVEKLDLYKTRTLNAPILVFIHGGAWRRGSAKDYAFAAEMFLHVGAHYAVPDFVLVQNSDGNLRPMAEQVRRAVYWIYKNAHSFGGDPEQVFICGHSSGAHLAAVALTTDWTREFDLPENVLKGGVLLSGMYDLKPVRLSRRSSYVKFDDDVEDALSPIRHIDKLNTSITIGYGTEESPEFQRQAREFARSVGAAGKSVRLIVGEKLNHFEVQETMSNPYGFAGRAVLEQMRLAPQTFG